MNQNICSWCHCQGLPRPVSKHIAYSVYGSAHLDLILSCRVCDFLPKKYFHNSHFINHNLEHLISAPTTFHPPCNLSSALQFLTHPAIVSPTCFLQFFHPPRNLLNLPHPAIGFNLPLTAFFSTSCTPHFSHPAPRKLVTSTLHTAI